MNELRMGKEITAQSQEIIYNVFKYFENEGRVPEIRIEGNVSTTVMTSRTIKLLTEMTAAATGVSPKSVSRIVCNINRTGKTMAKEKSEKLKHRRAATVRVREGVANIHLDAIRKKLHSFYIRGDIPTCDTLLKAIKEDPEPIYTGSRGALYNLLSKNLGFSYQRVKQKKLLLENREIVDARREFLNQMRERGNLDNMVFVSYSWINKPDSLCRPIKQQRLEGLEPPKGPKNDQYQLILFHAGTTEGFVPNCLHRIESISELNSFNFSEWFAKQLLPNIPPNSCVMLNTTENNTELINKTPNGRNTVGELQTWLARHNIWFSADMEKSELVKLIRANTQSGKKYTLDGVCIAQNHKVYRVPPCHDYLNPMDIMWSRIRVEIARQFHYNFTGLKTVSEGVINNVTIEDWKACTNYAAHLIDEYWESDKTMEKSLETVIEVIRQNVEPEPCSGEEMEENEEGEELQEETIQEEEIQGEQIQGEAIAILNN